MRSGCMRSTRRAKRVHGRLSCASPSGSWQMAMFMESPDTHACPWVEIQLLAGSHVERLVPRVEVAHRGDAKAFGRVIGGRLLAQRVVAVLAAPGVCETQEEVPILLADVTLVLHAVAQGQAIGIECGVQAGEIGGVLDQHELAVEVFARGNRVVRVLRYQRRGGGLVP